MRARHNVAKHKLYYDPAHGLETGPDAEELRLTDWPLNMKCKAHGCSNAVEHGLRPHKTVEIIDEAKQTVKGLQKGATGLYSMVQQFMMLCLAFRAVDEDIDDVIEFWTSMSIDNGIFDLFLEVNPRWNGVVLFVNGDLKTHAECWQTVSACIFYCLRWFLWSLTRWCRVGLCARMYLRSVTVGVDRIYQLCVDAHLSMWDLHMYSHATTEVGRLFAVAAFSTWAAEKALLLLLEDDRLLKRMQEIKAAFVHDVLGDEFAAVCVDSNSRAGLNGLHGAAAEGVDDGKPSYHSGIC